MQEDGEPQESMPAGAECFKGEEEQETRLAVAERKEKIDDACLPLQLIPAALERMARVDMKAMIWGAWVGTKEIQAR